MTLSLVKRQRVEVRGFGSFGIIYRPTRLGRNPKSGAKVSVPTKFVPHFNAGRELIPTRRRCPISSACAVICTQMWSPAASSGRMRPAKHCATSW